jgi:hypothetical protein
VVSTRLFLGLLVLACAASGCVLEVSDEPPPEEDAASVETEALVEGKLDQTGHGKKAISKSSRHRLDGGDPGEPPPDPWNDLPDGPGSSENDED